MSPGWTRAPERGSPGLLRFMIRLALGCGWRAAWLLLHPIAGYFLLFSPRPRAASRQFLTQVLGRPATVVDLFRHYFTFASTLLDRVFLLTGRLQGYEVEVFGLDLLLRRIEVGDGVLLLGAHLGSFEVLRALAAHGCPVPVKALIYEENAVRTTAALDALNPDRRSDVIPIGGMASLLRVKEALDGGALVGILGDRLARGDRTVRARFMGRPANFPAGPLVIASVLKVPVVLFFGIHRGNRRYEVHFEPFAERIELPAAAREAAIAGWAQRYADALERQAQAFPYNWFNFYDFWDVAEAPSGHPLGRRTGAAAGRASAGGGVGYPRIDGPAGGGAGAS